MERATRGQRLNARLSLHGEEHHIPLPNTSPSCRSNSLVEYLTDIQMAGGSIPPSDTTLILKSYTMTTDEKIDALRWQMHAETSASQLMAWWILALIFNHEWFWGIAAIFILGNSITLIRASMKLPRNYLNYD